MSPSQQRALASQYGFNLDEMLGFAGSDGFSERAALGAPGEPLEQVRLRIDDGAVGLGIFAEAGRRRTAAVCLNLFDSEVEHLCTGG